MTLLALARSLFVAAMLSSFGTSLFAVLVWPPIAYALDATVRRLIAQKLRSLLCRSVGIALVISFAWLMLETAALAETNGVATTFAALPSVLFDTRFGQVLALQCLLLAAALATTLFNARSNGLMPALGGAAVLLESGHSHAFAMSHGISALIVSQALHLLAAGAWLGGLLPLLTVLRHAPPEIAQRAARRFSGLAGIAVLALAATALFQGTVLSGSLKGLTGTAYGAVLLIKILLFGLLIALAANNRFRLTPALVAGQGQSSKAALIVSIALETGLGLCAVLAAGVLSGLEPGMHMG